MANKSVPPPHHLVDALHDRIHKDTGNVRPAKSVKAASALVNRAKFWAYLEQVTPGLRVGVLKGELEMAWLAHELAATALESRDEQITALQAHERDVIAAYEKAVTALKAALAAKGGA